MDLALPCIKDKLSIIEFLNNQFKKQSFALARTIPTYILNYKVDAL